MVGQLHERFKKFLNSFHAIGESVENNNFIIYALKAFSRSNLWLCMVDDYKVSRDLFTIKLSKLFYEFELHKQVNTGYKKNDIALIVESMLMKKEKKETPSGLEEFKSEGDISTSEMTNFIKKIMKKS